MIGLGFVLCYLLTAAYIGAGGILKAGGTKKDAAKAILLPGLIWPVRIWEKL